MVIYNGHNSSFDQENIKDCFIQRVIGPHVLRENQTNSVLFLDNAPCHKTLSVKEKLDEFKIKLEMIPPRMTRLVQPADVSWFRSIKSEYHKQWTNWYINNDHAFTKAGNLKSPGYINVGAFNFISNNNPKKFNYSFKAIQWISQAWRNLNVDTIRRSFDLCGITSQNNLNSTLRLLLECESSVPPQTVLIDTDNGDELNGFYSDSDGFSDSDDSIDLHESEEDEEGTEYSGSDDKSIASVVNEDYDSNWSDNSDNIENGSEVEDESLSQSGKTDTSHQTDDTSEHDFDLNNKENNKNDEENDIDNDNGEKNSFETAIENDSEDDRLPPIYTYLYKPSGNISFLKILFR